MSKKESINYKKFYNDIKIHVEMMVDDRMRAYACADANHHELSFQIFRLLSGYSDALDEIEDLKGKSNVLNI